MDASGERTIGSYRLRGTCRQGASRQPTTRTPTGIWRLLTAVLVISTGTFAAGGLAYGSNNSSTIGLKTVAAGGTFSCAVLADRTVMCWGDDSYGQLGDGGDRMSSALSPVRVPGLAEVVAISAGGSHACALRTDSSVACWGWNGYGQVGSGPVGGVARPETVIGLSGVVDVAAGSAHSCALLSDGTVRCWGRDYADALGTNCQCTVNGYSTTPVIVDGVAGATAISAGGDHTCALIADGSVRCWGDNSYGGLGASTPEVGSGTPVNVSGFTTPASAVALGSYHSCALLRDGTVVCWGWNAYGELGDGTTSQGRPTPAPALGVSDARTIAAGSSHTCATLADGTARCWGFNVDGELGDGTTTSSTTPVTVAELGDSRALTGGGSHSCAVTTTGTISCWGANDYGQLGDGTQTRSSTPAAVIGITPGAPTVLRNATAGDSSATVNWIAPVSDGGSPIIGYAVVAYIGLGPVKVRIFNSPLTTQTITGLTNGTEYRFRVIAYNAIGVSGYSKVTNPVTPNAQPT
jgi:alpha-tubulin suppressor-like RCC1 family protein